MTKNQRQVIIFHNYIISSYPINSILRLAFNFIAVTAVEHQGTKSEAIKSVPTTDAEEIVTTSYITPR